MLFSIIGTDYSSISQTSLDSISTDYCSCIEVHKDSISKKGQRIVIDAADSEDAEEAISDYFLGYSVQAETDLKKLEKIINNSYELCIEELYIKYETYFDTITEDTDFTERDVIYKLRESNSCRFAITVFILATN